MKTIEDIVPVFPGAKVFSVLDAKLVFLQIILDTASSYLTAKNPSIRRYR